MANVPTDEAESVHEEPVSVGTIRDAILSRIPDRPELTRDVRIHDGIADISLRWRTLRFSTSMAYSTLTPEEIAAKVEEDFKAWLASTIKNMNDTHRHSMAISEMAQWLADNPPEVKPEFVSNKTAIEWVNGIHDMEAA